MDHIVRDSRVDRVEDAARFAVVAAGCVEQDSSSAVASRWSSKRRFQVGHIEDSSVCDEGSGSKTRVLRSCLSIMTIVKSVDRHSM